MRLVFERAELCRDYAVLAELFIVGLAVPGQHVFLASAHVGLWLLNDSQWNVLLLFDVLLWQAMV